MFGGSASKESVPIVANFRRVLLASLREGRGRATLGSVDGPWGPIAMGHDVPEECAESKLN